LSLVGALAPFVVEVEAIVMGSISGIVVVCWSFVDWTRRKYLQEWSRPSGSLSFDMEMRDHVAITLLLLYLISSIPVNSYFDPSSPRVAQIHPSI
jgi:hypothetical protein